MGVTDYIFVLDVWPPPTPKNMLESDFVHAKTLIRSALKIVVNPNRDGAEKCTRHQPGVTTNGAVAKNRCKNPKSEFAAFCKAVTFEDKTTSLEFDGMSRVKRKPVMSQYKHNILKSLMAIKAHKNQHHEPYKGCTAEEVHQFLCHNIQPPLDITEDQVDVTNVNLSRLFERGCISREKNSKNRVYRYFVSDNDIAQYNTWFNVKPLGTNE